MNSADLVTAQALIAQGRYVDCIWGDVYEIADVNELDTLDGSYLVVLPFRAAEARRVRLSPAEHRSKASTVVIQIRAKERISRQRILNLLPINLPAVNDFRYEPPDSEYAELVERIIHEDITGGRGSNFVIPRSLIDRLDKANVVDQHAVFNRLL